jgi:hypothetical protein
MSQAHPAGAATADLYGRLPLHYLLDHKKNFSVAAIQKMIKVNFIKIPNSYIIINPSFN